MLLMIMMLAWMPVTLHFIKFVVVGGNMTRADHASIPARCTSRSEWFVCSTRNARLLYCLRWMGDKQVKERVSRGQRELVPRETSVLRMNKGLFWMQLSSVRWGAILPKWIEMALSIGSLCRQDKACSSC